MEKKRISYFDIARGLGIILVVIGHLEYISLSLRYSIVSFHIPLFFIISGMLSNYLNEEKKDYKEFIISKARILLIPYFWFSLIYLSIIIVLIFVSDYTWTYFFENLWQTLCLYGMSVLWFLPALFLAYVIFIFLRRNLSHLATIIVVTIATPIVFYLNCGLVYLHINYSNNFWFFHIHYFLVMILRVLFTVAFMCIGYYFRMLISKIKLSAIIDIIIGIVLLGITAYFSQINQAVDIHFLVFNIWYIYLLCSVAGSFGIIFISHGLERVSNFPIIKLIRYYGRNSLTVMTTHMDLFVLYVAITVSLKITGLQDPHGNFLFCALVVIILLIVEVFIIEIINRFFPFLVGKRKK